MRAQDRDLILWALFALGALMLVSQMSTYASSDARICERAIIDSGEASWRFSHPREITRWCNEHERDWRKFVWPRTLERAQEIRIR